VVKQTAIELNSEAARLGRRDYCAENLTKSDPYTVETRERKEGGFFIEGNEAVALGSIFGGVQMLSWYPITPSSSLAEGIIAGYLNYELMKERQPMQYFKQKMNWRLREWSLEQAGLELEESRQHQDQESL
jgi:hypothetical protein